MISMRSSGESCGCEIVSVNSCPEMNRNSGLKEISVLNSSGTTGVIVRGDSDVGSHGASWQGNVLFKGGRGSIGVGGEGGFSGGVGNDSTGGVS